ncbi:uncharacterized protein LOC132749909 [Ruditapes philippinarum]|uniref:uncharacterized protein LOC132749909 n=1 Tax=Ruditapes philippinarum TaxID=129788 RepID=UPI00295B2B70|nr:uncharacterized protein LOC132749909 [Ruditapes philippinarum]
MATGGCEVALDAFLDFQCLTCTNKVGVKYCVECQGYCCQSCVDTHSRFPTLKSHTLLDRLTDAVQGLSVTLPTEICAIHTTMLVNMYCKDHDEVGCSTCKTMNHRACSNVHSIPDEIGVLFDANELEDTKRCLDNNEKRFKSIEQKKEDALIWLKMSIKEADTAIDNAKQEVIDHVEKVASQSKEEVVRKYQAAKDQIEKDTREANETINDLMMISKGLRKSEGNKSQQFVLMKIANRKMKEANEKGILKHNGQVNISFDVNSVIQDFISDIKNFGRVSCPLGIRPYSAETIKDMNVKLQDDKSTCNIFGSCLLEDGTLLLTDYNNKRLKRVNIENMTVDGFCSFDKNPYCVCCTSKVEAVVTFYSSSTFIQFVTVGAQLTPSRKINMNHKCLGISYKDDKLYIANNAQSLYIHDMSGNELQKISTDSTGSSLFNDVREICIQ